VRRQGHRVAARRRSPPSIRLAQRSLMDVGEVRAPIAEDYGWILSTECVQSKAGASSGRQSRQGKSQEPCSVSRRQEGNQMF
jgi:hypothetical protein